MNFDWLHGLLLILLIILIISVATSKCANEHELDPKKGEIKGASVCGTHTTWNEGTTKCVIDSTDKTLCGAHTTLSDDGKCVVAESACLSTTKFDHGQCRLSNDLADAMNFNYCVFYDHGGHGGGLRKYDMTSGDDVVTAAQTEVVIMESALDPKDSQRLRNPPQALATLYGAGLSPHLATLSQGLG